MSIAVLIPSYRRPHVLKISIPTWLKGSGICYLVVVADSPLDEEISLYKQFLVEMRSRIRGVEIIYELHKGRRGSVNARNKLLEIANRLDVDFVVMADDDYILPYPYFLKFMAERLEKDKSIGAIGGKVVMIRKRTVDPDFFLNFPVNIADALTKVTGFIFLDVVNGPRYAEFITPFYMLRRDILKYIRYDPIFGTSIAYREESDIHMQIKKLGYRLLLDPRVYVLHLGLEEGGNRPSISMGLRLYWKARNHAIFIKKHFDSINKRLWYLFLSTLLLSIYRPWYAWQVLRGTSDGLRCS